MGSVDAMTSHARRGKPTLAKVAAVAGVSVSQASDALRGLGRVSEETRDRVRAAAQQLGYRSQGSGRALRSGSRPLVVFHLDAASTLAPDGSLFLFWSNVVTGFVKTMQDHGHHVILDIGGDLTELADLPGEALLIGSTDPSRMRLPPNLGFGAVVSFAVDPDAAHARDVAARVVRAIRADRCLLPAGCRSRWRILPATCGRHRRPRVDRRPDCATCRPLRGLGAGLCALVGTSNDRAGTLWQKCQHRSARGTPTDVV